MKNLLILLITFLPLMVNGQQPNGSASTTEEEYNYLTKGYRIQVESGLDMKKGYEMKDLGENKRGVYSFNFKALIRSDKLEIAGLLCIAHSEVSGKTYYLCIPYDNKELLERYYKDISNWDYSIIREYAFLLSNALSNLSVYSFQLEKRIKN